MSSDAPKSIWMPIYIGDYLADTQLLNTEQHGAYILLILAYWQNKGPLPSSPEVLRSITKQTPAQWKKTGPAVLPFFKDSEGKLVSKRIDKELATAAKKQKESSDKARAAAIERWRKQKELDTSSNASGNAPSIAPSNASSYAKSQSQSQSQKTALRQGGTLPELDSIGDFDFDPETGELLEGVRS